jgi:hypothetical protein
LLGIRHGGARFSFPDRQHMVIVVNVGAEKQHTAIVLTDLREAHHFGEKLARVFKVSNFEYEMADALDLERHDRAPSTARISFGEIFPSVEMTSLRVFVQIEKSFRSFYYNERCRT